MKLKLSDSLALGLAFIAVPGLAQAYIGPGLGAGAVAATLGVIGSLVLALFAVIYYPIKRLRKKMRGTPAETKPTSTPGE